MKILEGTVVLLFGIWSTIAYKSHAKHTADFCNNLPKWLALRSKDYRFNARKMEIGFLLGGIILLFIGILLLFGVIK